MKKLVGQILKFGLVGGFCTVIDFAVFSLMNYAVGLHYLAATFLGFTVSLIVNYILSMRFVFVRRESLDRRAEFAAFAVLSVIGLALNELLIYLCVDGLYRHTDALQRLMGQDAAEMAGKLVATGLVMVYNFVTRKLFLEQKPERKEA